MAKSVEERLMQMLAAGRGGKPEVEGAKELKLLKDRNVSTKTAVPAVRADARAWCECIPRVGMHAAASPPRMLVVGYPAHRPRRAVFRIP